jgi:hypothetical protein
LQSTTQLPRFNQARLRFFIYHIYGQPLDEIPSGIDALIARALDKLPYDERYALALRYCLYDVQDRPLRTMDQVSVIVDPPVTKQAIVQRVGRGIRRLRSHSYSADIRTVLQSLEQ